MHRFSSRFIESTLVFLLLIIVFNPGISAAQTAEVSRSGDTWTTTIEENSHYSGNSLADAIDAAVRRIDNGTINIRNSGNLTGTINPRANQTFDFHGNEINATRGFSARHTNGITIRNLRMTGAPNSAISFHGCSYVHLHNISMIFSGNTAGGVRIDNDRYSNLVRTTNLRVTGVFEIQGTRGHGFETYGIDSMVVERFYSRHTNYCGLILNETRNAEIGYINAFRADYGGGYAGFRTPNGSGPNITVDTLIATECGRGFFSLTRTDGVTINYVEITGCSNIGIWIENVPNNRVLSGYVWENRSNTSISGSNTRGSSIDVQNRPPPGGGIGSVLPPPFVVSPEDPPVTEIEKGDGEKIENLLIYEVSHGANWNIRSGIQNGQTVFGDRDFTFADVPDALAGEEWIQTAMNSRSNTSLSEYAEFSAKEEVSIYIAHSDRVEEKPDWLSEYDLTDMVVTVQEDATTQRTLSVYQKTVSENEQISLGINSNDGTTTSLMYFVIVTEVPSTTMTHLQNTTASSLHLAIYPSSFYSTTTISYNVPKHTDYELNVYALNGELVKTLKSRKVARKGVSSISFDGSRLASGVYFVKLTAGNEFMHKRMFLMK
ncbi:T9SS type A sorting domain-containing protein [Chitinispirillales bacterium ANBcel5]|uniref:T9SS type A sorting domain-containing protein n=1 Tax=Cellulosispirillum alkaliphilum TaxID=3039283 RepID=UPI002A538CA6|nr:T9SS type A sorting domain-containing protein [Chitinispirillales bacterium ANBcel5]